MSLHLWGIGSFRLWLLRVWRLQYNQKNSKNWHTCFVSNIFCHSISYLALLICGEILRETKRIILCRLFLYLVPFLLEQCEFSVVLFSALAVIQASFIFHRLPTEDVPQDNLPSLNRTHTSRVADGSREFGVTNAVVHLQRFKGWKWGKFNRCFGARCIRCCIRCIKCLFFLYKMF